MKVKLDENVSSHAAAPLRALGHDVDSVFEERLSGADDATVGPQRSESRGCSLP
jgi:hypothetical protein